MNIMVVYFLEMMEYNEYLQVKEKINFAIADIVYKNGASFIHPGRALIQ
jgi:MscS family membrane protein